MSPRNLRPKYQADPLLQAINDCPIKPTFQSVQSLLKGKDSYIPTESDQSLAGSADQADSDFNLAESLLAENVNLRRACRDAANLIGMNEDETSLKAWGILKTVVPS